MGGDSDRIALCSFQTLPVKERENTEDVIMPMTAVMMLLKVQRKADGEGRKRAVRTMGRRPLAHRSFFFVCTALFQPSQRQCPRTGSHSSLAQFSKTRGVLQ